MEHESRTGTAQGNSDRYEVDIHSCSNMDCTGLIPAAPQSIAEIEHYNQLYPFLPQCVAKHSDLEDL